MAKTRIRALQQGTKRRLLLLVTFLLALYVIVPQLGSFSASVQVIKEARLVYVAAGLLPLAAAYCIAAGTYQRLALRRLHYPPTLLVQIANGFANRLLPAGLGGLTLSVQYLKRTGHTLPQALAVAGLNNTLGFTGHMALLALAIVLGGERLLDELQLPGGASAGWIIAVVAVVALANLLVFRRLRRYVYSLTADTVGTVVVALRKRPFSMVAAQLLSIGLTAAYVLVFYACCLAVGISLSPGSLFTVFTVGMIATTVTPTPGGLGGAEAGFVAGLVAYGVDAPTALAGVLLYRLLTYWLPFAPGFMAFVRIRKKYL